MFEIRGTNVLTFLLPALQFCPLYDYLQRLHARCIIEIGIGHFENVSGRTVLGHEGKKSQAIGCWSESRVAWELKA